MSRIDEALRRAEHIPNTTRGQNRVADGSLRLADELTIEQYPVESRPVAERENKPLTRPDDPGVLTQVNLDSSSKLIVGPNRNAVSLEQYRRLAATLHEAQVEKGLKTVMVTSATSREGKTLTVVNLALTLSESYGRRVLLIDADLRRPAIHEVLGIPNDRGLSEVLREASLDLPLVHVSPHLAVLTSGRHAQNPQAALSSEMMRTLLQDTAERFDWVLVDTPPVGLLSDAQILGHVAQAVVFVIRAGSTPFQLVEKAVAELGRDRIIGTVLNGLEDYAIRASGYYDDDYYRE